MNQQREGPLATNAAISDGAVRLMHEYTGRGPTRSHTTINTDSVMVVLGDTLTKGSASSPTTARQSACCSCATTIR